MDFQIPYHSILQVQIQAAILKKMNSLGLASDGSPLAIFILWMRRLSRIIYKTRRVSGKNLRLSVFVSGDHHMPVLDYLDCKALMLSYAPKK